jgi:hypothetical protein
MVQGPRSMVQDKAAKQQVSLGREDKTRDNSPLVMIFNMLEKNGIVSDFQPQIMQKAHVQNGLFWSDEDL